MRRLATNTPDFEAGFAALLARATTEPEVSDVVREIIAQVRRDGEQLLVTGNGEALQAIIAVLARQGVIAHELRVDQATLDDAFVALTSPASTERN